MLSRLYEGEVTHHRRAPEHDFTYPVWYAWLNLDEIDAFCGASRWVSRERFNLLSFYRQDYLPDDTLAKYADLKSAVASEIHAQTGRQFDGEVFLLTTPRQLGYAMNPISLFYCYEHGQSQPAYIIAEVHNTPWGERHTYVLEPGASSQIKHDKEFHVSPFMPMDLTYVFNLPAPTDKINVGIRLMQSEQPIFNAHLSLSEIEVSATAFRQLLIAYGWQSIRTLTRIYFQALRLWMKQAMFFAHPARGSSTQNVKKSTL